uniref:Uncharacterized protein n=1 Tax=Oryza meridionalis TaxID=40149 RepID=A0A0E0F0A3_9ORYZ
MRWAAESIRQQRFTAESLEPLTIYHNYTQDPSCSSGRPNFSHLISSSSMASELIPDDLKAFVDLAGAATDDVVKGMP